jgi:hypothetical protein
MLCSVEGDSKEHEHSLRISPARRDARNKRDNPFGASPGGGEISMVVVLVASRGRAADQQAAGLAAVSSTCPNIHLDGNVCARQRGLASWHDRGAAWNATRDGQSTGWHRGRLPCAFRSPVVRAVLIWCASPYLPWPTTLPGRGIDRTSSTLIHLHVPIHLPFACPPTPMTALRTT